MFRRMLTLVGAIVVARLTFHLAIKLVAMHMANELEREANADVIA